MARLRYQFDEHMEKAVARGLLRHGIDAITTAEASLLGAPDSEQLAHAQRTQRVMVTQDDDFLRLHYRGASHCGIVYSPRDSRSIGDLIEMLILIDEAFTPEEMIGRLEFI